MSAGGQRKPGVWQCLNTASEFLSVLESVDFDPLAAEELDEAKETVLGARNALVPFLWAVISEVSFDVCVQSVLDALTACVSQVKVYESLLRRDVDVDSILSVAQPITPSSSAAVVSSSTTGTISSTTGPTTSTATSTVASPLTSTSVHTSATVSSASNTSPGTTSSPARTQASKEALARQTVLVRLYEQDFLVKQRVDQFTALFPTRDAQVTAPHHLIRDTQGRALWSTAFRNKLMVPWDSFLARLESYLSVSLSAEEQALRYYVDFTHDGYVTPYEFGVFLCWFGPLVGCVQRLMESVAHGYLAGFVPAYQATILLNRQPPGAFLVRFSKTQPTSFALTLIGRCGSTKHCLIYSAEPSGVTLGTPPTRYASLHEFVSMNADRLRYPIHYSPFASAPSEADSTSTSTSTSTSSGAHGVSAAASAPSPATGTAADSTESATAELRSREEQQALDQCVVCMDAPRNTVFLECRHMVCCSVCAPKVSQCPMCRQFIVQVLEVFRP